MVAHIKTYDMCAVNCVSIFIYFNNNTKMSLASYSYCTNETIYFVVILTANKLQSENITWKIWEQMEGK